MKTGAVLCVCCRRNAGFDDDPYVVDDRKRVWCIECAEGLLAQVGQPDQLRRSIEKDRQLREAEELEKRAAKLREEARKP